MSEVLMRPLEDLMARRAGSVDPSKFPDEQFDLYSIPAFDKGCHEVVTGAEIGSTKQVVEPGDVLLSKIVPHIRRSWVVGQNNGRRMIASGEWIVFRGPHAYPAYLRHVLVGDPFHSQFMQTVSGVGGSLLRARPAQVAKIAIPLPSLPEQLRIAAILDHADNLRAKRREVLAQLDRLTQAIFVEMFGSPIPSRTRFEVCNLSDACKKISDGTHHSPPIQQEGVPYITAKHLKRNGLDFFSDTWYVSQADHKQIYARCDPQPGDVLYIKDGATTGIAAINKYDFPFSMLSSLALIRTRQERLLPAYLCEWLNQSQVKTEILGAMAGAAIRRLTLAKIKAIKVPVPPLALQREFADVLDSLDTLRTAAANSSSNLERLFAALQSRAFRGEL